VGDPAPTIAQHEFRYLTKRFDGFAAAIVKIAAVQRRWRDFRIAP
jgi:hypothetical protein